MNFSDLFRAELKRTGFTHSTFAERVGVTPGMVSLVATGRTKVPMDRVGEWANAFGLAGAERKFFILHAGLAHIPDQAVANAIAEEIESLIAKVDSLSERVRALSRVRSHR